MMRVRTLGVLALFLDDGGEVPAEVRWRKNSALLVYLARSPGGTRTREHLCGLLWSDKPESAARHSLNEALRVLRKTLGDGAIETDARQVTLRAGTVDLDADAFESTAEREAWEEAAGLVGGEFLEGFGVADASAFEDWLAGERAMWRDRSVHALVAAADERLAQGRVSEGQERARRALALDPFSDLAARSVIRALALEGDRGGALALYRSFVERLAGELGAEPDPETERFADRVRRERTWRLPPALAPDSTRSRVELIGRETEMRRLSKAWQRCRLETRAAVLMLEGEPGIGKTRLLEELAARVRMDGGTVAGIRCVPADRDLRGSGLRGLCAGGLLEAPGLLAAPERALASFAAELPEWQERFRGVVEPEAGPLAHAFSDLIAAVCDEQPALLTVDDAEWLDEGSIEALELLLRDLERRPVALALAAAGPDGRAALDDFQDGASEIPLERLAVLRWTKAACSTLVGKMLPEFDETARDRLARRILADSAGLPLLAVELTQAVRDGLTLEEGGLSTAWPDTDRTLEQTMPGDLPDTVRSALRVGFRRLSRAAQTFLSAASVLESARFDPDAVSHITGLTEEERDAALEELEWTRWLHAEPRGYSFVARIARDVVAVDMLTPGQRRRLLDRLTVS